MTSWLQDKPTELVARLDRVAQADLRTMENGDEARALVHAASRMIKVEILGQEQNDWYYTKTGQGLPSPLHWSWGDRVKDALACLFGTARVLRRLEP